MSFYAQMPTHYMDPKQAATLLFNNGPADPNGAAAAGAASSVGVVPPPAGFHHNPFSLIPNPTANPLLQHQQVSLKATRIATIVS